MAAILSRPQYVKGNIDYALHISRQKQNPVKCV